MQTRTNIVLNDKLVAQAMRKAGVDTKKAAIEAALKAYVKKPDDSGLIALVGSGASAILVNALHQATPLWITLQIYQNDRCQRLGSRHACPESEQRLLSHRPH
jgi:Arc/MetJ family transcription regulator